MEWVVLEFEREYANGERLPEVRKFVNRYVIQGGEHKRRQDQERRIQKKITLLTHLLAQKRRDEKPQP